MSDYSNAIDIWSVGCILGELLQGSPLFRVMLCHIPSHSTDPWTALQGTDVLETLRQVIKLIGKPREEDMQHCASSYMKQFIQTLPHVRQATHASSSLWGMSLCADWTRT